MLLGAFFLPVEVFTTILDVILLLQLLVAIFSIFGKYIHACT